MEGKKSSFVDELLPKKEAAFPAKSDILSSIIPPRSSGVGKDYSHSESSSAISGRKQGSVFHQSSNGQNRTSGGSPHGSPSKRHNVPKKNNIPIVLCEIPEPCLMSSSVHYGGRDDFIPENSSSLNSGSSYNYKDKEDDFNSSDVAIRGEWWQGSFYY